MIVMDSKQNFTSIEDLVAKPAKKRVSHVAILTFMLLAITLPVLGFFVYQTQISSSKADESVDTMAPDVPRWCRDNSFTATMEAPSQVNTNPDGTYSFTAHTLSPMDEICATIRERMDEITIPGIPYATRATNCADPILSNGKCSVAVSWGGRYGPDPENFTVSGSITSGSTCQLYLLALRGIPVCSRSNVTVIRAAVTPTPTPVIECPLPKLDVELNCPLCNTIK